MRGSKEGDLDFERVSGDGGVAARPDELERDLRTNWPLASSEVLLDSAPYSRYDILKHTVMQQQIETSQSLQIPQLTNP